MHTVDVVVVCVMLVLVLLFVAILARQRFMMRVVGSVPLALRSPRSRWQYGVGRYAGGELRWYRSLGLGTRPTRVWQRAQLRVISHHRVSAAEQAKLPEGVIVIECAYGGSGPVLALGPGAYTGFVSWLESSAPRS